MLVAGFQGVSTAQDVTTLGRGGSDTTAVALAAADRRGRVRDLHGRRRRVHRRPAHRARRPQAAVVSFEEMLEMAASRRRRAAAALRRVRAQPRRAHPLPIELRRRAGYRCGRRGGNRGAAPHHRRHPLDRRGPRHAARRAGHARASPGGSSTALAEANVNVDMIIQNEPVGRGRRAPTCRSRSRATTCAPRARARAARRRARHADRHRRDDGQGLDRRRGNEDPSGRRREGVHDARRARASTSR